MQVEFVTNACFLFTLSDGTTLLSDPWLSDGIYHGTMFNYPPISDSLKQKYRSLKPDYIYISHLHGDHFDPPTLAHFDNSTPILIGKFPTPIMLLALKGLGFQNVLEVDFGRPLFLRAHQIYVYSQFSGSSDDISNDSGIDIDTSILIIDENGQKCFFAVDNPMQERHADSIKSKHGPLDLAILPYTGASIYPFCYKNYSNEEKLKRARELRKTKLDKFVSLSRTIGARHILPAAGSFVLAGKAARYATFQPQPTPNQIIAHWRDSGMDLDQLCLLSTGDRINLADANIYLEPITTALDRDYTEEDRTRYADTKAEFACDLDLIQWPESLRLQWRGLISRARVNMWRFQLKSAYTPALDVYLIVESSHQATLPQGQNMRVKIAMDDQRIDFENTEATEGGRPYIEYFLSAHVLLAVLLGGTYWNVAEYHMQVYRNPDRFEPATRSTLGLFKV